MSDSAKNIHVAPIVSSVANALVRRLHYSGKVAQNSQLHLGVFWQGRLEGAMQFGPSLDKSKLVGLVRGTLWNSFLELNRLAFSDRLPRNSESRALAIALRMIRKHYPHVQWVVSFADGTQSGDGTIYRASGFVLTGIKKNTSVWVFNGASLSAQGGKGGAQEKKRADLISRTSVTKGKHILTNVTYHKGKHILQTGAASMKPFRELGFAPAPGYQLRYVYFLDPTARERLTCPILPFSKIDEIGAGMYKGQARVKQASAGHHPAQRRGSADPHAPQKKKEAEASSTLLSGVSLII